jgi:hypothetical protein
MRIEVNGMKRILILGLLMITGLISAQAQTSTELTLLRHLNDLKKGSSEHSTASLSYSYGMVLGYYVQGKNELKPDIAQILFTAQDTLKLKNTPSLENAVHGLNELDSGLTDPTFCLFKGIATGNYFAGKEKSEVAMAATADQERFERVCR